jgi:hypothetical protein
MQCAFIRSMQLPKWETAYEGLTENYGPFARLSKCCYLIIDTQRGLAGVKNTGQ